ncbi:MAG TPA: endonuclease/exonuclease/phosphatase family protein [Chitinophagaceae bacterium]|nr:endonuclease/exonuclease/phosphatase family protein [Chitinophagaceae bacterium]
MYTNIAMAILLLLSCLASYLNPQNWWVITFLGLGFPFLLLIVCLYLLVWLILQKPRLALISGIALLLSFKSISVFFAFHPFTHFNEKKEPGSIRIVTWNVARFIELKKNNNEGSGIRKKMFAQLKAQNADILCLQEFHTATRSDYYNNISAIQEELHYPYYNFVYDLDGDSLYYSSIIFSRFPIVDSGFYRYPRPTLPEVLLQADIDIGHDTIRVFTTHLQSVQLRKKDYEKIHKITEVEDSLVSNSKNILSKIKVGFTNRSIQANIISNILGDSPHPVIFCGDLNDVPNSYTYFQVRGDLQDAFLKKGFGIGRSFSGLSPTLRIDYIFADRHFTIHQFKRTVKKLSDHYMLTADISLKHS